MGKRLNFGKGGFHYLHLIIEKVSPFQLWLGHSNKTKEMREFSCYSGENTVADRDFISGGFVSVFGVHTIPPCLKVRWELMDICSKIKAVSPDFPTTKTLKKNS